MKESLAIYASLAGLRLWMHKGVIFECLSIAVRLRCPLDWVILVLADCLLVDGVHDFTWGSKTTFGGAKCQFVLSVPIPFYE